MGEGGVVGGVARSCLSLPVSILPDQVHRGRVEPRLQPGADVGISYHADSEITVVATSTARNRARNPDDGVGVGVGSAVAAGCGPVGTPHPVQRVPEAWVVSAGWCVVPA